MKGIKRTAKATSIQDTTDTPGKDPSLSLASPGLIPSLIGLLASAVLVWLAIQSQPQQHEQLLQAWGSTQAGAVNRALRQINAETLAAATDGTLAQTLQNSDPTAVESAQNRLRFRDGVVGARLNPPGFNNVDNQGAIPVSFATLDMLAKAGKGETPAPEARKVGDAWLIYSVAPLRTAPDAPITGTLLLAYNLQRLTSALPDAPADVGQIVLSQQFGTAAAQIFLTRGQSDGGQAVDFATGYPNWKLTFAAGPALQGSTPWLMLLLALLVAVNILREGRLVIASSVNGLMDTAAPKAERKRIEEIIHRSANGALQVHGLKTRGAGQALFVEFHMVVDGAMPVRAAHDICDRVEAALQDAIPDAQVVIHVEPEHKLEPAGIKPR